MSFFRRNNDNAALQAIREVEAKVREVTAEFPKLRGIARTSLGRKAIADGLATLEPVAEAVGSCHNALQGAVAGLRAMRGDMQA